MPKALATKKELKYFSIQVEINCYKKKTFCLGIGFFDITKLMSKDVNYYCYG